MNGIKLLAGIVEGGERVLCQKKHTFAASGNIQGICAAKRDRVAVCLNAIIHSFAGGLDIIKGCTVSVR